MILYANVYIFVGAEEALITGDADGNGIDRDGVPGVGHWRIAKDTMGFATSDNIRL